MSVQAALACPGQPPARLVRDAVFRAAGRRLCPQAGSMGRIALSAFGHQRRRNPDRTADAAGLHELQDLHRPLGHTIWPRHRAAGAVRSARVHRRADRDRFLRPDRDRGTGFGAVVRPQQGLPSPRRAVRSHAAGPRDRPRPPGPREQHPDHPRPRRGTQPTLCHPRDGGDAGAALRAGQRSTGRGLSGRCAAVSADVPGARVAAAALGVGSRCRCRGRECRDNGRYRAPRPRTARGHLGIARPPRDRGKTRRRRHRQPGTRGKHRRADRGDAPRGGAP